MKPNGPWAVLAVLTLQAAVTVHAETLSYTNSQGRTSQTTVTSTVKGYAVSQIDAAGVRMEYDVDPLYSILQWRVHDAANNAEITAERSGNEILISGTLKGKPYHKTHRIDSLPWYEDWGLGLRSWLNSSEKSGQFWSINPSDPGMISRFAITRVGTESLSMNGVTVETVRFSVSLAGLLSLLFKAEYWVRKSDGVVVRTRSPAGPGGPVVVVELCGQT